MRRIPFAPKSRILAAFLFALLAAIGTAPFTATRAEAHRYGLFVGPASVGAGDPNPVTFVSPVEYEAQFVHDKGLDVRASLIGLYAGLRNRAKWGGYATLGAGLMLTANGIGVGTFGAVGYDFFCFTVCVGAEYFQGVGIGVGGYLAPYALRLGVTLWL
jgi:hypothetical protein